MAVAVEKRISKVTPINHLFLPLPDTDFREFLEEIEEFVQFAPEILEMIEKDLDAYALKKKRIRLEDRKFFEKQTHDLEGLDIEQQDILVTDLQDGRPRMPAFLVYLFMMIRGFLGSLTTKQSRRFLRESMSLYGFLQNRGLPMPGVSTILENVNQITLATYKLLMDKQIAYVLKDELDDFKKLTIDSTSVKANSCWPTDSKIIFGLLQRAYRLGQKLQVFEVKNFCKRCVPHWLEEIDKLDFQICLVAGKPKAKGKLKKYYRHLLKKGQKAAESLKEELERCEQNLVLDSLPPSRRMLLQHVLEQIHTDITDVYRVITYAGNRVFTGETLPSKEKVLSLSDGCASYIKKGSRTPVIGYKPQLVRSENGFVTSLIVPQGNTADSAELVPAIRESIERTGIIAELVSTDDGYASTAGGNAILSMGVKYLSISGSKGRKITSVENWDSELYRDARRNRSAVESLMFTIKFGYAFGELGRRGIDAVRAELQEKVIAYNCCRIILIRKRRERELELQQIG